MDKFLALKILRSRLIFLKEKLDVDKNLTEIKEMRLKPQIIW